MTVERTAILRKTIVSIGTALACLALAGLAATGDFGTPMWVYCAVLAASGLSLALLLPASTVGPDYGSEEDRDLGRRLTRDFGLILVSVVVQCAVGSAAYPLTFRTGEDHDPSWFLAVAVVTLLLGLLALGLGYILGVIVLKPLQLLLTSVPGAVRGSRRDRLRVLASLMLLLIVALAISLEEAGADLDPTGRVAALVEALISLDGASPWAWLARALSAALAVVMWLLVRTFRHGRGTSATAAPTGRSVQG